MADKTKEVLEKDPNQAVVDRAKDFWSRNSMSIIITCAVVVLGAGGYFGYKYLYKQPLEKKASDALFMAESYFRSDSIQKALNGDGITYGFLKVIDKYGSTDAGNLARFYAGACYLKMDDNNNAVKYLKDFSTSAKQIQARAYKLLGDAYADLGKNEEAFTNYKKAAHHYEDDKMNSADYLFVAAYFAQKVLNKKDEATKLYQELKDKYPETQQGFEAGKYLAQMGVYN